MTRVIIEANSGKTVEVTQHNGPADAEGNTTGEVIGQVAPGEVKGFDVDEATSLFISEATE